MYLVLQGVLFLGKFAKILTACFLNLVDLWSIIFY